MSEPKALAHVWGQTDANFFRSHPERVTHIRNAYAGEHANEFIRLGDHATHRRRILLARIDFEGNPLPDHKVLKVPFLAFSDESIEDSDAVLRPILQEIMLDALKQHGTKVQP